MNSTRSAIWRPILRSRSFWAGFLLGVGSMAAVDEIVFHQLLRWHHFVDGASGDIGLISDGVLHAAELLAIAAGVVLMLDATRRGDLCRPVASSGFLVGLGVFQLWDGLVSHKVLRLHQIRYGVDPLAYDIVWNAAGVTLLLAGITVALAARRRVAHRATWSEGS